jgi:hypothetical protein
MYKLKVSISFVLFENVDYSISYIDENCVNVVRAIVALEGSDVRPKVVS